MEERLQNVLSHAGVASRRKSAELIAAGRVTVDGVVVKEPGERVDLSTAKISVDGKPLAAAEPKRTVMLYKPVGVLSSTSDPFGGKTVAELVNTPERIRATNTRKHTLSAPQGAGARTSCASLGGPSRCPTAM